MPEQWVELIKILADGRFHSGERLAAELGISRAAVWKRARWARDLGMDVHAVSGKGYRLSHALELLEKSRIEAELGRFGIPPPPSLDVLLATGSTNTVLLDRARNEAIHQHVCVAEFQSAGRGRLGRGWIAPFGAGIYMSVGWRFESLPESIVGLSLAIGVAVMRALQRWKIEGVGLKWPNDVMCNGRKLAGILAEIHGEFGGPCQMVIGVGVNVTGTAAMEKQIDQPWVDLARVVGETVSRNELAARLIQSLWGVLAVFEREGFRPFVVEWRQHDLIKDKIVRLGLPDGEFVGRAHDVDDEGALLLRVDGNVRRYVSGDVSLRVDG